MAEIKKNKNLIEEAEDAMKKHDNLIKEADDMRFQFDRKEAMINYGNCKKFDGKPVSLLPNTCQLETQECFKHRKDNF